MTNNVMNKTSGGVTCVWNHVNDIVIYVTTSCQDWIQREAKLSEKVQANIFIFIQLKTFYEWKVVKGWQMTYLKRSNNRVES